MGSRDHDQRVDWRAMRRSYKKLYRELKRKAERYAEYVLSVVGDLDASGDLVAQVVERLEDLLARGDAIPRMFFVDLNGSGEEVSAEKILEFLRESPPWHVDYFRDVLERKIRRHRILMEEMMSIYRELERFSRELGVYVPIHIEDYDRYCSREYGCIYSFKIEIGSGVYAYQFEGEFEELLEILKQIVREEAVEVEKLAKRSLRERRRAEQELPGLGDLLREIESHIAGKAMITIMGIKANRDIEAKTWDIARARFRDKEIIVYGASATLWPEFYRWLSEILRPGPVSIMLRSFLEEIDERTGLPVKEIRGYIARTENGAVRYTQLRAREVLEASTTDPATGKRLKPEPSVIYCGPGDEKIISTETELE